MVPPFSDKKVAVFLTGAAVLFSMACPCWAEPEGVKDTAPEQVELVKKEAVVTSRDSSQDKKEVTQPVESLSSQEAQEDENRHPGKLYPSRSVNSGTQPLPINVIVSPDPIRVRLPGHTAENPVWITEAEAVRQALAANPKMRSYAASAREARGRYKQARADAMPQVTISSDYDTYKPFSTHEHSTTSTALSVEYDQLLYDFGYTSSNIKNYSFQQKAAEEDKAALTADLVKSVRSSFYGLIAMRRLSEVARANLENRRRILDQAKAKWEAGSGLPSDVIRAESQVASAVLSLNAARADAVTATIEFSNLLGMDPTSFIEPDYPPVLPANEEINENLLISEAKASRHELKAARYRVEAAEYYLRSVASANAPSLSASVTFSGYDDAYPPRRYGIVSGLSLSWNAIDGGNTKGQVEEAKAAKDRMEADLDALEQQISAEAISAAIVLRTALASLAAADAAETNAREAVRIAEGRYAAGLGSFLEVTDAHDSLLSSSNRLVASLLAAWKASVDLDHALGRAFHIDAGHSNLDAGGSNVKVDASSAGSTDGIKSTDDIKSTGGKNE
ncbi:MAG: TolC family protein [bacterium]|nr:TolC family protein [bacterium]